MNDKNSNMRFKVVDINVLTGEQVVRYVDINEVVDMINVPVDVDIIDENDN